MYDVIIVGTNTVSLAIALSIYKKNPHAKIAILERDSMLSSLYSQQDLIIHSVESDENAYYKLLMNDGYHMLLEYCNHHKIEYNIYEQMVVASQHNGNDVQSKKKLSGLIGDHWETKKVNIAVLSLQHLYEKMLNEIKEYGGDVYFQSPILYIKERKKNVEVVTSTNIFEGSYLINCAGFYADRVARLSGYNFNLQKRTTHSEYYRLGMIESVNQFITSLRTRSTQHLQFQMFKGADADSIIRIYREETIENPLLRKCLRAFKNQHSDKQQNLLMLAKFYVNEGIEDVTKAFSKRKIVDEVQRFIPHFSTAHLQSKKATVVNYHYSNYSSEDEFHLFYEKYSAHLCISSLIAGNMSFAIGSEIAKKVEFSQMFSVR
ncbi:hypothetical protein [Priestia koreensis]|uniref:FAD dependent oxidoreductase domain-containing protein n=1 Tax=Priestia koreensis TaxID=284581 RepID=A0A0M0L6A7_9BACI|nr:hypothetical protein [Priestia koreensis]KOO46208.1 hypothetical protein AMD01_10105 [Priestia koreensis]